MRCEKCNRRVLVPNQTVIYRLVRYHSQLRSWTIRVQISRGMTCCLASLLHRRSSARTRPLSVSTRRSVTTSIQQWRLIWETSTKSCSSLPWVIMEAHAHLSIRLRMLFIRFRAVEGRTWSIAACHCVIESKSSTHSHDRKKSPNLTTASVTTLPLTTHRPHKKTAVRSLLQASQPLPIRIQTRPHRQTTLSSHQSISTRLARIS